MTIALVTSLVKSFSNTGEYTTAALNTTGANLIVLCFSYYAAAPDPTVTDNKGNTYIKLTPAEGAIPGALIYYCQGGTVGAGHTWTVDSTTSQYRMLTAMAFSGVAASPLGLQSGASSGGATAIAPGSVTPTQDGELIVATAALRDGGTVSVSDGFTLAHQIGYDGNIGIASAYKIQTTAAAANPSFSWASSVYCSAALATFKAETGGGAVTGDSSITLGAITGTAEGTVSADGSVTGSSAITLGAVGISATGAVTAFATLTIGPLQNNTSTVLALLTGITVHVYQTSGAPVVTKTGQTTNGSGMLVVSDAAIAAATEYRCVIVLGTGAEGMDKVTAA